MVFERIAPEAGSLRQRLRDSDSTQMNPATDNRSLTPEARPAIEELDCFTARPDVRAALRRAQQEAEQALQRDPALQAAFVAVDPASLGWTRADLVGSIRVVVTRYAGGEGLERHTNSEQYLLALDDALETHVQTADGWRTDRYGHADSSLEDRWHVVPRGLWHRTVAPDATNWGVVAFHSAREVSDEYR
jgi:hypothetical protein